MKIAYITTARSDYGPSYWLIHDLFSESCFETLLFVGGSHLSTQYGMTVSEIEKDGWPVAARVPFLEDEAGQISHGRAAARALQGYSQLFAEVRPDLVVVYGDRYELLPIASAAVINQTPMAHVCGGDLTGGAIDDQVRHAVTKMAHLHFPSTARSSARILQMGEEPWRVHNVGDPALDHFVRGDQASAKELTESLGFMPDRQTLLVTFHPATLEVEDMPRQTVEIIAALNGHQGGIVITAPAPDPGSLEIRSQFERLARNRPMTVFVESLGSRRYRGLLHLVGAMVGNSSSGLNEAPCARLPVVNIGRRQEGREKSNNVLDVPPDRAAIGTAIETALSAAFRSSLTRLNNPYGNGCSASQIIDILKGLPPRETLIHKQFRHLHD